MSLESVETNLRKSTGNLAFIDNSENRNEEYIKGFTQVENNLILSTLTDKAFRLYTHLQRLSGLENYKVSIYNLAQDFNCSEKTISRVLQELKKAGFLKIISRFLPGQMKAEYSYKLYKYSQVKQVSNNHPTDIKTKMQLIPTDKAKDKNVLSINNINNNNINNKEEDITKHNNNEPTFIKPKLTILPPPVKNIILEKTEELIKPVEHEHVKQEPEKEPEQQQPGYDIQSVIDSLKLKKIEVAKNMIAKINGMEKQAAWDFVKNKFEPELKNIENQLLWRTKYCNGKDDPVRMFFKCCNERYPEPTNQQETEKAADTPQKENDSRYAEIFDYCRQLKIIPLAMTDSDKIVNIAEHFLMKYYYNFVKQFEGCDPEGFTEFLSGVKTIINSVDFEHLILAGAKNSQRSYAASVNDFIDYFKGVK